MRYFLSNISNFTVSLMLKIYKYRISKKEEKIQSLKEDLSIELDSYRTLLYNARRWANKSIDKNEYIKK